MADENMEITPKVAIPDIKMKFNTDSSDLVKVDQFLNTMHQFDFENLSTDYTK
jgi:hypothetical protein